MVVEIIKKPMKADVQRFSSERIEVCSEMFGIEFVFFDDDDFIRIQYEQRGGWQVGYLPPNREGQRVTGLVVLDDYLHVQPMYVDNLVCVEDMDGMPV